MSQHNWLSLGETAAQRRASRLLFLIGLGAYTQINIGGYAAISEFFLVLLLPFNLLKNLSLFRRDGISSVIWLLIFWMVGVCISDLYNDNIFPFFVRGMIPPVAILATIVACYPLLKRSPGSFKWAVVGIACSSLISVFIFQRGCDVGTEAVRSGQMSAVEAVAGYKLFWVGQLNQWLGLAIKGWQMQLPNGVSFLLALFLAVFALAEGGRSAFMIGMVSALFLWFGGKTYRKMRRLRDHMVVILISLVVLALVVKGVYKFAAEHGFMGEEEIAKYEMQAKGKNIFETIVAGRAEFFISLMAIKDHPWVGHGSFALDNHGYWKEFFIKYGDPEVADELLRKQERVGKVTLIPAHSHFTQFWLWSGILGLLPWVYFVVLFAVTLLRRMHVFPPAFGYFVLVLPAALWHVFFSPLGSRINFGFMVAMCLLVRVIERAQRRR